MPRLPSSIALVVLATLLLGGCAHRLLPDASTDASAAFADFAAAEAAFRRIEPQRTAVADLKALGFDVAAPNVRVIGYPDLVQRLAPNSAIPLAELDPGVRSCILAPAECRVYEIVLVREDRHRTGGFVQDFLAFERTTEVSGWRFEALIAVRGDVVVFRGWGGVPRRLRIDHEVNPLGPLQSIGETAAGRLLP